MQRTCRAGWRSGCRGVVVFDAVVGLVMISAMVAVLAGTIAQQRRTATVLSAERDAVRLLEDAAAALPYGDDALPDGVRVERVDAAWQRLTFDYAGGTAELFVPTGEGVQP